MDANTDHEIARNNSWHYYDKQSNMVVVFVHGYFSCSEKCWRNKNRAFWPEMVLADPRIPHCSIFLGGYFTGISSRSYGVRDCVDELFSALGRLDTEGRRPVLSFPTIAFVCHSLGGIVVREMLTTHAKQFLDKRIGLALMASPSLGSDYASNLLSVARFYGNRVGKQLAFGSAYLEDLDRRFIKYLEDHPRGAFIGAEAIEIHSPFYLKFLPDFSPIVPSQSAGRYFSNRQKISENHSSIVKPTDIDHPSHNFLVDFTNRLSLVQANHSARSTNAPPRQARATDVLFDIYEPDIEPHYIVRNLDLKLSRMAELHSIWITGDSGLGKSCSIMRYVAKASIRVDVSLSQCGPNASKESILQEINGTLEQRKLCASGPSGIDLFQQTVSNLATLCSRTDDACIFIDEVPAGTKACASDNLLSLLADLITSLKQRGCQRSPRFFICSLARPNEVMAANPAKLGEHMSFIHAEAWTEHDLRRLYEKIIRSLPNLTLPESAIQAVMHASEGSPRFFKTYFRTAYSHSNLENLPNEVLRLTRQQLRMDR